MRQRLILIKEYNSEQGERGISLSLPCSGLLLARLFVLVTAKLSNYYFTSKYSPPFLSYNPIFHRWQHLYRALMWAIVVVIVYGFFYSIAKLIHRISRIQIDVLLLDSTPKVFNLNVVFAASLAIHTYLYAVPSE